MEYKQAKKIREKSFGTLLAEQEGGIASSIRATISQKTQAKMAGIQEKFDPLNIAKIITGGSNWAPAMLGKLTGRKQSSTDYFSGVKRRDKGTAEKLSKDHIDSGDFLGILQSIESLLHKTREEDKLKAEENKNHEEERNLEKARRHKELISAITGKPYTEKATTATKVNNDNEPIDNTTGVLGDIFAMLSGAKWLLTALASPAGMIAALLAAGIAGMILQFRETDKAGVEGNVGRLKQALRAQMTGPNGEPPDEKDVDDAARSVLQSKADQGNVAAKQSLEMMKANPESAGVTGDTSFDGLVNSYLGAQGKTFKTATKEEREDAKSYAKEQRKNYDKGGAAAIKPPPQKATAVPINEVKQQSKSESIDVKSIPTLVSTPTPEPVIETPKPSQALMEVQKTNLDLNLPVAKPDVPSVVNNNVNSVTKNGKKRSIIPLVRNNEETLQRLIFNSTRVV